MQHRRRAIAGFVASATVSAVFGVTVFVASATVSAVFGVTVFVAPATDTAPGSVASPDRHAPHPPQSHEPPTA